MFQNKIRNIYFLSIYQAIGTEAEKTLESKGYAFEYIEVPQGHNRKNWKPLIDDALIYFFGKSES